MANQHFVERSPSRARSGKALRLIKARDAVLACLGARIATDVGRVATHGQTLGRTARTAMFSFIRTCRHEAAAALSCYFSAGGGGCVTAASATAGHITPSVCGAQRSQRALKKQEGEDTLDVSKPHPQELCEKCRKLGCVPTDPTDPRPPHYESVAVPRSTRQQGRLAIAQRDFPAARFRIACSLLPEGSCVGAPCPPDITAEWTKSKSTGSVDENNCSEENVNNVGCTAALVGCS